VPLSPDSGRADFQEACFRLRIDGKISEIAVRESHPRLHHFVRAQRKGFR
jgi:hypothetical protein